MAFQLPGFALFGLDGKMTGDLIAAGFTGPWDQRDVATDELVVERCQVEGDGERRAGSLRVSGESLCFHTISPMRETKSSFTARPGLAYA